ncbi:hypothetical protein BCR37DRAFT_193643 [Protomyces lactucae-debilis]|uniref:Uncharacterized protein n=1 Tax=Protomyces lactucae-debilis TaxID=2754530 RepID=A0A1Y2EVE7_PROLT|nr:uncharacterized protein BCR37DRAFT_193643 [Protomyces lactucae-debilis]ORY75116.1 hypothetical protein BCR37DRAFT_193643 [Protomyces lactucae-debilis]
MADLGVPIERGLAFVFYGLLGCAVLPYATRFLSQGKHECERVTINLIRPFVHINHSLPCMEVCEEKADQHSLLLDTGPPDVCMVLQWKSEFDWLYTNLRVEESKVDGLGAEGSALFCVCHVDLTANRVFRTDPITKKPSEKRLRRSLVDCSIKGLVKRLSLAGWQAPYGNHTVKFKDSEIADCRTWTSVSQVTKTNRNEAFFMKVKYDQKTRPSTTLEEWSEWLKTEYLFWARAEWWLDERE